MCYSNKFKGLGCKRTYFSAAQYIQGIRKILEPENHCKTQGLI